MRGYLGALAVISLVVLIPSALYAQATIAGTVQDASGAVLPGVTVEAASPELIEKVRTGVTDTSGQYRIENLRPASTASHSRCPASAPSSATGWSSRARSSFRSTPS